MQVERIAELLQPYWQWANDEQPTANDALCKHISTYIDILLRWNTRINLTAIRNEDEIVTRHFGESLFAARHLFPEVPHVAGAQSPEPSAARLADLGSGAGFPGIPIKLWAPDLFVTLIESNHKKATFLREVVRSLALTEITVRNSRAEALPGEIFEILTLRAVDRISAILPVAGNLLVAGGRLALLTSSSQVPTIQSALPTFAWNDPILVPNSEARQLIVGMKSPKVGLTY